MKYKFLQLKIISFFIFLLSFGGCTTKNSLQSSEEIAFSFIKALNNNYTKKMISLSELPFRVFSQEWESAEDGYGYLLGDINKFSSHSEKELSNYFIALSNNVKTENSNGEYIPVSEYNRLENELAPSIETWETLDVFLFLRGFGDVEHIFLVGVKRGTKKVMQIYYN